MKHWVIAMAMAAFGLQSPSLDAFDSNLEVDGSKLVLNGQGTRKKLFVSLYDLALYLTQSSRDAPAIIAADEPAALQLMVTSSLITPEKMESAIREGFDRSGEDVAAIRSEIDSFIAVFGGISEGDVYEMVYRPGTGTEIKRRAGQEEPGMPVTILGLPFRRALLGIWLSDTPVQSSLKEDLLGG